MILGTGASPCRRNSNRAPMGDRTCKAESFRALDRPIESHPSHHLRIGEMLWAAANLPDSLVWLGPDALKMGEESDLQLPAGLARGPFGDPPLMERVHHLAEHVELALVVRIVADADGGRTLVTGQPWYHPLRQAPLAGDSVHDLDLFRITSNRPEQPFTPVIGFLVVA